jgi:lipid A ethanolaminephosphotransferase
VGLDAHQRADAGVGGRNKLLVVVVGETARAMNFSLNGYDRDTNPELARRGVLLSFTDVSSCGTATAVSVPCMFQDLGRKAGRTSTQTTAKGCWTCCSAGVSVLGATTTPAAKGPVIA